MNSTGKSPRPLALRREGPHLIIEWEDQVKSMIPWTKLRRECPCASCQEERAKPPDPFRILKPEEIAAGPPSPVKMIPKGLYAYQIIWNDGHDTGIYSLTYLRSLSDISENNPPEPDSKSVQTTE